MVASSIAQLQNGKRKRIDNEALCHKLDHVQNILESIHHLVTNPSVDESVAEYAIEHLAKVASTHAAQVSLALGAQFTNGWVELTEPGMDES